MELFLSWSGEMSHKIAEVFRRWLPYVIQNVKPFISSDDIDKGQRWSDSLADKLETIQFGIICVTPFNIDSPWLNFEAGALSKAVRQSNVFPFLFKVNPPIPHGPLQQFQTTTYDKEDIFHLLLSINKRLANDQQLTYEVLRDEFEKWWPDLRDNLDKIDNHLGEETETGLSWLYGTEDIISIQTNMKCDKIWIITPDLFTETSKMKEAIKKNLEREPGIEYTFIIPSSIDPEAAKEDLGSISEKNNNKIKLARLPRKEFDMLAVTDYLVFNPTNADPANYPLSVYLEVPIVAGGFWIKVESKASFSLRDRFQESANKAINILLPGLPENIKENV